MRDDVDELAEAWARERPDLDLAPVAVFSRISRLSRHLDLARRDAFAAYSIELWEFDVLAALRRTGAPYELSPGRLLRETLVTSGTMTNRVDRLAARGFVERFPTPTTAAASSSGSPPTARRPWTAPSPPCSMPSTSCWPTCPTATASASRPCCAPCSRRTPRPREMEEHHYLIRGGIAGRERLRLLARVMRPATLALLERAGVTAGLRCLDVGCGGGDVTFDLASLVGITGHVVGVLDPTKVELARGDAEQAEVANVEFRVADLTQGLGEAEYDVVYARFLLTHLRDPAAAVALMRAALRPGGRVVLEDIDYRGSLCYPESDAFRRNNETTRRRPAATAATRTWASGWPACCSTPGSSGSSPPSRTRSVSRARSGCCPRSRSRTSRQWPSHTAWPRPRRSMPWSTSCTRSPATPRSW